MRLFSVYSSLVLGCSQLAIMRETFLHIPQCRVLRYGRLPGNSPEQLCLLWREMRGFFFRLIMNQGWVCPGLAPLAADDVSLPPANMEGGFPRATCNRLPRHSSAALIAGSEITGHLDVPVTSSCCHGSHGPRGQLCVQKSPADDLCQGGHLPEILSNVWCASVCTPWQCSSGSELPGSRCLASERHHPSGDAVHRCHVDFTNA